MFCCIVSLVRGVRTKSPAYVENDPPPPATILAIIPLFDNAPHYHEGGVLIMRSVIVDNEARYHDSSVLIMRSVITIAAC